MLRALLVLPLLLVLAFAGAAPVAAQTAAAKQATSQQVTPAQIEKLKKQIGAINQWLTKAEKDRSQLQQQLTGLERSISDLTREARNLKQQAASQKTQLTELETRQRQLTVVLNDQREQLKKLLRQAWMEGDASALKVLFNETDPNNIARTLTYYEYLGNHTVGQVQAFQDSLAELNQTRTQMQNTRARLATTEADVEQRQQELTQTRKQREQTLASLNADIDQRRSERDGLAADQKRLEALLKEVQQAITSIPAPNPNQPFATLRERMPWPAAGTVVSSFGETYADGKLRRNGLLMHTDTNAEVRAIHYGRVVFANWLRGFGLLTIIDHGDGYMTLYGHASSLYTTTGDWVDAGEAIAQAGQTGGTDKTALYFEIRHNGKPDNPSRWLAGQPGKS
ncbi:murein hydrolase activator EnvC family protein [Marinobacter sp. BSs20148]|jgi:septal ring factor EnvC (AmiA/AmiB activator)|uniref:murein hydrolase activator EnvC family protein n=1 Tax=Marinobacter TaxID=2742 RepID=UPI0002777291|nr:peptidoglycan DD-metalloendopeptidase family protein [Marinobacter sp. BSs20148]AFP32157.1 Murein hydrolase activator EnvC [Marinobacter sp. BSs20148]